MRPIVSKDFRNMVKATKKKQLWNLNKQGLSEIINKHARCNKNKCWPCVSKRNLFKNQQFQKIAKSTFCYITFDMVDQCQKFKKWHVTMVILYHIQLKHLLILHFYYDLLSKSLKIQTSVHDT